MLLMKRSEEDEIGVFLLNKNEKLIGQRK